MVHAVVSLKCKKGHVLPISFDRNNCGCHHDGKPCIIINCRECITDYIKDKNNDDIDEIVIPLDEDGMKVVEELLK